MGNLLVRAFWGPRPQDLDDGTRAIVQTLDGLRELDAGLLGRWFDSGKSRTDALAREVAVEFEAVRAHLRRNGEGGSVIEELGYNFYAWNGAPNDDDAFAAILSFSVTSKWVKNSVVIGLPGAWANDLASARRALDLVVSIWQPEEANVWDANHELLLVAEL